MYLWSKNRENLFQMVINLPVLYLIRKLNFVMQAYIHIYMYMYVCTYIQTDRHITKTIYLSQNRRHKDY